MPTIHLLIKGKVQGVFYRATAKKVAHKLSLKGWIRNTQNGDVEAMAAGEAIQLHEFEQWCKRGPAEAIVTHVIATPAEDASFNDFSIK